MSDIPPLLRIPVGVVVERRKAASPWIDVVWRPVAVLAGLPEAAPWTLLASEADRVTFYAGPTAIELYRSESDSYRRNLTSDAPSLWVALQPTEGDPPYAVATVTADPAEGESLTEPGQGIVDCVPMPEAIYDLVAEFVARHPREATFSKRKRDRVDPEVLGRHSPGLKGGHER